MIQVEAVYVGNVTEAYIEARFSSGMNIIWSDDNHRGKTIVMQSIMYAMGSIPVFPKSFLFRNYIYAVDLDIDSKKVSVLRNKASFVVKDGDTITPFESLGDFQAYWSGVYHHLPIIVKNGKDTLVGTELYNQLSFVPQDKRTSSRVYGYYFNKNDFVEMLYATARLDARQLDSISVAGLKAREKELRGRRKTLMKQVTALKERGTGLGFVSPTADREDLKATVEYLNELRNEIAALRKHRNRCLTLQKSSEVTRSELMGLSRTIKSGGIVCLECGSQNIGYKVRGSDFVFDITTSDMRGQIIRSLDEQISAYANEIEQINSDLRKTQLRFDDAVVDKGFTLGDMLAVQGDYANERDIDRQITDIDDALVRIADALGSNKQVEAEVKEKRAAFRTSILDKMNYAHGRIDSSGSVEPYDDIFTTEANPFSGSETTEYYLCRVYALANLIDHGMPIVIDSFRAEELSTMREGNVLALFGELPNQVILTATLKKEEGPGKYDGIEGITSLDYSDNTENKLLSKDYVNIFHNKLREFHVEIVA